MDIPFPLPILTVIVIEFFKVFDFSSIIFNDFFCVPFILLIGPFALKKISVPENNATPSRYA